MDPFNHTTGITSLVTKHDNFIHIFWIVFFYTYHGFMVADSIVSLVGRQTIIWSNAEFLLINWTLTTRFGEM